MELLINSEMQNLIQSLNFKGLDKLESKREAWFNSRMGKFTASEIHKLLTCLNKPNELPKGAITYIEEKALEVLTNGKSRENYTNDAMQWGNDYEIDAITEFEKLTGFKVEKTGKNQEFIEYNSVFGGTPDGIIPNKAIIEVKCPKPKTHFFNVKNIFSQEDLKKHYPEYYWQIVTNMICSGLNLGYFISYDPRFEKNKLMFIEVNLNLDDVGIIDVRLRLANKLKMELIKNF